jgi:hypothetical protein
VRFNGDHLDQSYYIELFNKKIKQDLKKHESEEFRDRFTRGVQIAKIPKFRDDKEGWDDFLGSFEDQLMFENEKGRSQSLVFQRIRECVEIDVGDVCLRLRSQWQKNLKGPVRMIREFVDQYHKVSNIHE